MWKVSMKGISYWIWIAGGVIVGLIIFAIAYQQIVQIEKSIAEQRSLEHFSEVKNIIDNLCWSFVGNKREYTISLSEDVEGIYTTLNQSEEYKNEQLINKTISGENATGNFLCIKIADKRLKCEEMYCNATMPFMGSVPEEFSLSILINRLTGKGKISDYYLEFERMGNGVNVSLKTTG